MFDKLYAVIALVMTSACGGARSQAAPPAAVEPAAVEPAAVEPAAVEPAAVESPHAAESQQGEAAAQSWLALVDEGKYPESWSAAADVFRAAISQESWTKAAAGVRQPLGKLVSRQIRSSEYKTSLPGAADGHYVVIQFNTVFENKAQAVETVTPKQDADGAWKVSGYFIR